MSGNSQRHAVVLEELVEWWEDLSQREIGSQAVLIAVPSRWGRTTLLKELAAIIEDDEALSIVAAIGGASFPDGLGLQAQALREHFRDGFADRRVAELLGMDRLGGVVQLGLGVVGLFVSPLGALVGLLLASVGVGAVGKAWDSTPAGKEGVVARLARAVAAVSVSLPVVVVIDDADRVDSRLAVTLVENLIERADGQVLVVAAADPGSDLISTLLSRARYGLTAERVHLADANPDMGYEARAELAAELCPQLPAIAIRRIAARTGTFADVFAVASTGLLAEAGSSSDDDATVAVVDEVINARPAQVDPSPEAVVLAWAGGILHASQAERALAVLDMQRSAADPYVVRFESLVRLADPVSPRLAEQVAILPASKRRLLAAALLAASVNLGADPGAGVVDRVVAWQATRRVRADLQDRKELLGVQCHLVHSLEELGDLAAAAEVAETALTEYLANHPSSETARESDELSAAVLRLARTDTAQRDDPLIETIVAAAIAGGAAVGLEARLWASIDLLGQPSKRDAALKLADHVTDELGARNDLGAVDDQWRLLLAFHVGRPGYLALTQQLLAPMLTASMPERQMKAEAVLLVVGGPGADIRLQIVGLEAELEAVPADADDDRLRLHHVLGSDYERLGDYHQALLHGRHELPLRIRLQGPDHPDILTTRGGIARWTGQSGNPAEARRLFTELLPDVERVLGPDHPDTLNIRTGVAQWTGESGRPAEALRLYTELLPDKERALGHDNPSTLLTRNDIAGWIGESGNPAEALRLFRELLPDLLRVLGPDYPYTLWTRGNIAGLTGDCGDPAEALRLFQELLPDRERVFGSDHPDTLLVRANIAAWTGESGNPAEALRLFQELLPDRERVFGPDHPDTLATRRSLARWAGESGNPAEAARLSRELLPDVERVLGPDHPDTLAARASLAAWTGESGNPAEALRLSMELLPDDEQVLGRDHPNTLQTRANIAALTGECGDPAEAVRLFWELLPDLQRVLGSDHPDALVVRGNIAAFTGEAGNPAEALRLFTELLPDVERILGPDHPRILMARGNIAEMTGQSGNPEEAVRLFRELLPDVERVLSPDHPGTLDVRHGLARWTREAGDAGRGS